MEKRRQKNGRPQIKMVSCINYIHDPFLRAVVGVTAAESRNDLVLGWCVCGQGVGGGQGDEIQSVEINVRRLGNIRLIGRM